MNTGRIKGERITIFAMDEGLRNLINAKAWCCDGNFNIRGMETP